MKKEQKISNPDLNFLTRPRKGFKELLKGLLIIAGLLMAWALFKAFGQLILNVIITI